MGYTVVRPGPLLEEPGGYKALVFDQGNRIAQAISCADAADVALKAFARPRPHLSNPPQDSPASDTRLSTLLLNWWQLVGNRA